MIITFKNIRLTLQSWEDCLPVKSLGTCFNELTRTAYNQHLNHLCLKTCLHCLFWISYFKEQREIQPITKMNYYNSKINRVQINSFVFRLIILIRLHNNSIPLAQRQNINKNGGVRLGEETPNPKGLREVYSWHKAIIFLCFGFYLDEIFVKINTTKTKHSVFNTADFICRHGSDSHRTFFFLDPRKS